MLVDAALRHRATVFFLMVALLGLGLSAYLSLPREKYPDIDIPLILVYVPYPGAAPEDVESQIVLPIERELAGLEGLKDLFSNSKEGLAILTVELESGSDIDATMQKVRDRVDRAKVDFPDQVEEPALEEVSYSDVPVLQVHLSGDVGPVVLKRLAEELEDEIETLPGVLGAGVVGGREREVRIDVDPEKLRLHGLAIGDVVTAIRQGNASIPGGELDLGGLTYAVRVPGEVDDPLRLADFVVTSRQGRPVFVRDVATVTLGFEERASYSRIDGRESVTLTVQKRVGANIIEVIDAAKEMVAEASSQWPDGVEATFLGDLSVDIRRQVNDLEGSILSGLILVVLVLMFALGVRNALFVALAIPFSMLGTFLVVELAGVTLNMVVLFALVLGVGMLVDNAVVVIENIFRHMQEGADGLQAASAATREVGGAIAISTFTTLGAFAPLFRWPGVIGDFMKYLPWTVSIALLASLLVAFTVNPVICSLLMRVDGSSGSGWGDRFGAWGVERYRRLLIRALDHRWITLGLTALLFVTVIFGFSRFNPGVEFLPEEAPKMILVDIDLPGGSRIEKTNRAMLEVEAALADLPDLKVMAVSVGEGSRADGFGGIGGPNVGRLSLDLVPREERVQSSFVTKEEVRRRMRAFSGLTFDVFQPDDGPKVGDPLAIELTGDDFATLGAIAAKVKPVIEDTPHLVSLDDDFDLARPEVLVKVDRVAAARHGLTVADIAITLRTAVHGAEASTYRFGDDEIDVMVRAQEASRQSIADLGRLIVVSPQGEQIPLSSLATLERSSALSAIFHKNRQRMVTVSGKVSEPKMADPVRQETRRRLEAVPDLVPDGYQISFAGQEEEEEESKQFLANAFLYAVIIVLTLMVGKFDSMAIPLIIITSVVMSMVGVLMGLLVTGMPFSIIMTGVGIISLAGIVVNNAIVLLDYGEQLVARGLERRQAVVLAGTRRLRPVVLTAITTILGLLPLTTGMGFDFRTFTVSTGNESSQYWGPMGVAVIFGLTFATFLTLVLVPVLYDGLLGFRQRWGQGGDRSLEDRPLERTPEGDGETVNPSI